MRRILHTTEPHARSNCEAGTVFKRARVGDALVDAEAHLLLVVTVGKISTDRQSKKFSSTDDRFLWTVGICALNNLSTAGTEKDPISTEILD